MTKNKIYSKFISFLMPVKNRSWKDLEIEINEKKLLKKLLPTPCKKNCW